MKRLVVILLLLPVFFVQAQDAKTCFVQMPDSLLPLLTAVNRADCIDFLESEMKAEVTNVFGRKSQMTQLSADYIRMQLTSQNSWQMKLLNVSDSVKVICVVATACAPACNSYVRFYTTDWQLLPSSDYLPALPRLSDFIVPESDTLNVYRYQAAVRAVDMTLVQADLSADNTDLIFTFTTPDYMDREAADRLAPFVARQAVVYRWHDGRYSAR